MPKLQTYETERRTRPFARRALMTFRPFLVRIRTRKPDTRFLFRLVPSKVRFVIAFLLRQIGGVDCEKVTVYQYTLLNRNDPGT